MDEMEFLASCFPELDKKIIDKYLKESDSLESIVETILSTDQRIQEEEDDWNERFYKIQTTWASKPLIIPRKIQRHVTEKVEFAPKMDWKVPFSKETVETVVPLDIKKERPKEKDLLSFLLYVLQCDDGDDVMIKPRDKEHEELPRDLMCHATDDLKSLARKWRIMASETMNERMELLRKAGKAYREHGGGAASYYSDEAVKLSRKASEYHIKAAQYQLLYLHPLGVYDTIDFHGLKVSEVTKLFWPLLDAWKRSKNSGTLTIITGSGAHSDGAVGKIKAVLLSMLQHQKEGEEMFAWKAMTGSIIVTIIKKTN